MEVEYIFQGHMAGKSQHGYSNQGLSDSEVEFYFTSVHIGVGSNIYHALELVFST